MKSKPKHSHPNSETRVAAATESLPADVTEALLLASVSTPMRDEQHQRIKRSMLQKVNAATFHSNIRTHAAQGGTWRSLAPKVDMKIMVDDGVSASWFARIQPGGRLPAHAHEAVDEECIVLSGSCTLDGVFMQVGDYQFAPIGSRHDNIYSETGCVLFIRSASFKRMAKQSAATR